jgi:hypothetical protein
MSLWRTFYIQDNILPLVLKGFSSSHNFGSSSPRVPKISIVPAYLKSLGSKLLWDPRQLLAVSPVKQNKAIKCYILPICNGTK